MVDNMQPEQMTLIPHPYRYIIDTCSILSQKPDEQHRRSVYNTLWKKIDEMVLSGEIVICADIKEEVEDDALQPWIRQCTILEVDHIVQQYVIQVVNEHPDLLSFTNMKSSGDAFLIAIAMKYRIAVITEENKTSPKKIPKICEAYNIPCYNVTELAEKEGWSF